MNWHLYRKDDSNTWPEIDCPMLVYIEDSLVLCHWDTEFECFIPDDSDAVLCYSDVFECCYVYIGYVPDTYKTYQVKKCNGCFSDWCGSEDDGYCMDEECKCRYQSMENEYEINLKRIWKEFE